MARELLTWPTVTASREPTSSERVREPKFRAATSSIRQLGIAVSLIPAQHPPRGPGFRFTWPPTPRGREENGLHSMKRLSIARRDLELGRQRPQRSDISDANQVLASRPQPGSARVRPLRRLAAGRRQTRRSCLRTRSRARSRHLSRFRGSGMKSRSLNHHRRALRAPCSTTGPSGRAWPGRESPHSVEQVSGDLLSA